MKYEIIISFLSYFRINLQDKTPVFSRVKEIQNRTVSKPEVCYEVFCQHPDGSFLHFYTLVTFEFDLIVQHISSELEHIGYLHIDTDAYFGGNYNICCTDAGEVVVASDVGNLYLYRISNGRLQRIYSTSLKYNYIEDVSSYRNQIYVNTFKKIIILDANLNINKTIDLPLWFDTSDDDIRQIVPCSLHSYITVTYGNGLIYCHDTKLKQIKYLRQGDLNPVCACLAKDDSVFIIGRTRILQVNSDMNVLLDLPVSVEMNNDVIFDRVKNRMILYQKIKSSFAETKPLTVIELE